MGIQVPKPKLYAVVKKMNETNQTTALKELTGRHNVDDVNLLFGLLVLQKAVDAIPQSVDDRTVVAILATHLGRAIGHTGNEQLAREFTGYAIEAVHAAKKGGQSEQH